MYGSAAGSIPTTYSDEYAPKTIQSPKVTELAEVLTYKLEDTFKLLNVLMEKLHPIMGLQPQDEVSKAVQPNGPVCPINDILMNCINKVDMSHAILNQITRQVQL